jgi:hypothetical protein
MKICILTILTLLISGCTIIDRTDRELFYTRSEMDAIALGIHCRNNARTLVQIARCQVRQ